MHKQLLTAAVVVFCVAAVAGQSGQSTKSPNQPAIRSPQSAIGMAGGIPRLPDGHPDLQGTYDLGTLTPLERAKDSPLVLTSDEAKKREAATADRSDKLNAPV